MAPVLTEDFKKRAEAKLEVASAGEFFKSNSARLLPSFDRDDGSKEESTCNDDDELTLGFKLGEGTFCDVNEITAIVLKRVSNGTSSTGDDGRPQRSEDSENEQFLPSTRHDSTFTHEKDEAGFPVNLFQNKSEIRKYMAENCLRSDDNADGVGRGQARYALKILRPTDSQKLLEQGLIDISIEARFLACLNHPNVIKMRGIAGEPLAPNFAIVLDRLYLTLEDKIDEWTDMKKNATSGGVCGCFGSVDSVTKAAILLSATTVAYDLSCALRYIHSQNLVYRDIKPANAGFDVRGDIKLFDFGFCKELTSKLLDKPSGLYKLTKMTGSPPYIAPENFLGKPYGKSCDVFSFGLLVWEMVHCKYAVREMPYCTKRDYEEIVIGQNYRPSIDKTLSTRMQELIKDAWGSDSKKRSTFDRISILLRAEFQDLSAEVDRSCYSSGHQEMSRSERMLGVSTRSFRMRRNK